MNGVRGERFMNILFCNIAWMKHYEGITEEDKPRDGGSYVTENGNAYESNNFKNYNTSKSNLQGEYTYEGIYVRTSESYCNLYEWLNAKPVTE